MIRSFKGHTDMVKSIVFSPDGKKLLSASYDRSIRLWDYETAEQIHPFKPQPFMSHFVFLRRRNRGLSAAAEKFILWNLERVQKVTSHPVKSRGPLFHQEGSQSVGGLDR